MPVAVSYPGVYVQEVGSGVRTITGVGTSIGLFVGRARKGELYKPKQCLNFEDFERNFTSAYAGSDLARSVKLFFQNGGTQCYVARVADEKATTSLVRTARIELQTEGGLHALRIESRSPGAFGNDIRMAVNYNTDEPEATFNLEVFRWVTNSTGAQVKTDTELYVALSMNPDSPRFAETVLQQQSKLVTATDLAAPAAAEGFSQSGRPIARRTLTILRSEVMALLDKSGGRTNFQFRISVNGGLAQLIDLGELDFTVAPLNSATSFDANLASEIENIINARVSPAVVAVTLESGPDGQATEDNQATVLLRIASTSGDVKITGGPSPATDIADTLMLGTANGGVEVSKWGAKRPAPNGLVFQPDFAGGTNYVSFAEREQDSTLASITIGGVAVPLGPVLNTTPTTAAAPDTPIAAGDARFWQDKDTVKPAAAPAPVSDGVREKWGIVAAEIGKMRTANPQSFPWTAELWGSRLAIVSAGGVDNLTATVAGAGSLGTQFISNVRYYSLGTTGAGAFQASGQQGVDGGPPSAADYEEAYLTIDREVDLFNLMVLPKDSDHSDATTRSLWGPASIFCLDRRAFLLMDPPADWSDSQEATSVSKGVATLRTGLVKDHAAVFYPNVMIDEAGTQIPVGPSGAIAGLMARIDASRGVWKAPAGTEADLRGVVGLEKRFTDGENGVMNPKAINTIRVFPNGIVNWGARTMDGDDAFPSDYKYVPIRRLALYIEESLYRGLKWVVFEPNDEPLWAQIRLNVGAFMNNLYRQGAFQGAMPKDAYFVKCDASTTTQNDRNLGIVNISVGFAPLKPAEFVVLTLQQMAGQIQT